LKIGSIQFINVSIDFVSLVDRLGHKWVRIIFKTHFSKKLILPDPEFIGSMLIEEQFRIWRTNTLSQFKIKSICSLAHMKKEN